MSRRDAAIAQIRYLGWIGKRLHLLQCEIRLVILMRSVFLVHGLKATARRREVKDKLDLMYDQWITPRSGAKIRRIRFRRKDFSESQLDSVMCVLQSQWGPIAGVASKGKAGSWRTAGGRAINFTTKRATASDT
jgi:hypothetical protein